MRRLEKSLRLNDWLCWLFRFVIVMLAFLWAAQLYRPLHVTLRDELRREAEYQRHRDPIKELEAMRAIGNLADAKVTSAKKMGLDYGPKHYFEDLYVIQTKIRKNRVMNLVASRQIEELQQIMQHNCKPSENLSWQTRQELARDKRKFWTSQISVEAEAYRYKTEFPDEDRQQAAKELKSWGWRGFLPWALAFYLRMLLLMLPVFLMRMIEDRGILETILADKRRFVLALVAWPYFFSKYPNNVIREIIVEAELRRIGLLFRRFSPAEKERVRVIANSSEYREWLLRYRAKNTGWFQRSLAFALLATIACMVFLPAKAKASTGGPSSKIVVVETIRAGPDVASDQQEDAGSGFPADLPRPLEIVPGSIEILLSDDALSSSRQGGDKIDHVPLSNCVTWASASKSCRTRRGHEIHLGVCGTDSNPAVDRLRECLGYQ